MAITGGCYCGAVRYELDADPMLKAQCHCRACQYISGGGANVFMLLPADGLRLTRGSPAEFARSDLDNPVTRAFCAVCGTHLLTRLRAPRTEVVLKVGTLDDPAGVFGGPKIAIHMAEAQPFHVLGDGVAAFDRLPPRPG